MPEQVFTIDVPGVQDIIKIPALEDEKLRQQRAIRFATKASPLPDAIAWIPDVINTIDDAEDLLSVFLTLAKPLLRRIPAYFVPGLGWVLLARDISDLTVGILGMSTTGRIPKSKVWKTAETIQGGKKARIESVKGFLNKTNWFGFFLEAGQVLEDFTGWGLQLGPIMGLYTDLVWGQIRRIAEGAQLRLRGPPPVDINEKAAQYLIKAAGLQLNPNFLTPEELTTTLLAQKAATEILLDAKIPEDLETRVVETEPKEVPIRETWNEASRAALIKAGLPENPTRAFMQAPGESMTFGKQSRTAIERRAQWEEILRTSFGKSSHGTIMQMAMNEGTYSSWQNVQEDIVPVKMEQGLDWKVILKSIEVSIEPHWWPGPKEFAEKMNNRDKEKFINCIAAWDVYEVYVKAVVESMKRRNTTKTEGWRLKAIAEATWGGRKRVPPGYWIPPRTDGKSRAVVRELRRIRKLDQLNCPITCRVDRPAGKPAVMICGL